MAQFIAFAISVFFALSIANALGTGGAPQQVRIFMHPPPVDANPAGVSGGGPVGTSVGHAAPTPGPPHGTGL